jgi:hypothetical protein
MDASRKKAMDLTELTENAEKFIRKNLINRCDLCGLCESYVFGCSLASLWLNSFEYCLNYPIPGAKIKPRFSSFRFKGQGSK